MRRLCFAVVRCLDSLCYIGLQKWSAVFFFTFYEIEWWFNAIIGTKTFQHSALYLGFLDTQFTCKKWQWQIYCDAITACYSRYNQAADSDAVMFSGDLNIVLWKVQQFCCYVLFFVVGFRAGVDGSRLSLTAWNHRQFFMQNDTHAVAGLKPYNAKLFTSCKRLQVSPFIFHFNTITQWLFLALGFSI